MNLVYCLDLGYFAFVEAENGMSRINMVAENVYNTACSPMRLSPSPLYG